MATAAATATCTSSSGSVAIRRETFAELEFCGGEHGILHRAAFAVLRIERMGERSGARRIFGE